MLLYILTGALGGGILSVLWPSLIRDHVHAAQDPARLQIAGSRGEFAWGGNGSTAFWVDPVEQTVVLLTTQLMPSSTYPLRRELRVAVNQALTD